MRIYEISITASGGEDWCSEWYSNKADAEKAIREACKHEDGMALGPYERHITMTKKGLLKFLNHYCNGL